MYYQRLNLEELNPNLDFGGEKTPVDVYMLSVSQEIDADKRFPCVVLCPGGGYGFTSDREAEPVAMRFLAQGINVAILRYKVAPYRFPTQLLQVLGTVSAIRDRADEWAIDTDKIFVMGFSAGGHLAGSAGVFWNNDEYAHRIGTGVQNLKPNGMILCYPVLSGVDAPHIGSFNNLLGEDRTQADLERMSIERQVSVDTPPAFLWHTYEDTAVPVENSLNMALAMKKQAISFELHIYPEGGHGLSLCDDTTAQADNADLIKQYAAGWIDHAIKWLRSI